MAHKGTWYCLNTCWLQSWLCQLSWIWWLGIFLLHFIKTESENVVFSKGANMFYIWFPYMVNVISFKYLLIVKRIVSMEQTSMTSCFYLHFRRKKGRGIRSFICLSALVWHRIKYVLTSIPYKWLKKGHVICFKYLLIAKLTVPMKLNLTTGHFFCIPWNKFVSLVRVHWLDSHQTCFNMWFPYMVHVILFKYLLIVKLIVSRKKVHCFDMLHHICLVKQLLYTI